MLFTHSSISPHFRGSEQHLDNVIESIANGELAFRSFPPLDVVRHQSMLWSLSNRRLYVARGFARRGLLDSVDVKVLSKRSPYLECLVRRNAQDHDEIFDRARDAYLDAVKSRNSGFCIDQLRCG